MAKENKSKGNVPNLRFSGFKENWEMKRLGEIATNKSEKYNPVYETNSIRCIEMEHLATDTGQLLGYIDGSTTGSIKNVFNEGDVLFGKLRPYLKKYLQAPFDGVCSSEIWVLKGKNISNDFLYRIVQSKSFIDLANQSSGSKMPRADWNVVESGFFSVPTLPEQMKISSFLSLIDERIQTQNKILQHYQSLIQNLREAIFKQKIGFKDKDGNAFPSWEIYKLKDIAERIIRKNLDNNQNVLTISAQHGLISQLEFFNKSVSAKNVEGYYLLKNGDFAYNKSYSTGYPMGAIKQLSKYDEGVVSTLYICFRFYEKANKDFMEHYFESQIQNNELEKIAQEGARNHGLLNVGVGDFFNIEIKLPCIKEQVEISKLFSSLSMRMNIENEILEKFKTQKVYLLKSLFI